MKILSWNIQWGRGLDGRVDLARIAEAAREHDPDVLCFQEVAVNHPGLPGGAGMHQPDWLAGLFLGYEAAFGVASDLPDGLGGRRQFGNLILSRRPLLQVFRHLLPWPAEAGVPSMQRAALEAVVAAPDYPGGGLRILTTHLEYFSATQRAAQCLALRQIADAGWRQSTSPPATADHDPPFSVLPRGEGCLLCGDFNAPAGAPEQEALLRPGDAPAFVNAWHVAHPAVPTGAADTALAVPINTADTAVAVPPAPTFGVHERRYVREPACYDMFYVSTNLVASVVDVIVDQGTMASDHQPVVLTLYD